MTEGNQHWPDFAGSEVGLGSRRERAQFELLVLTPVILIVAVDTGCQLTQRRARAG